MAECSTLGIHSQAQQCIEVYSGSPYISSPCPTLMPHRGRERPVCMRAGLCSWGPAPGCWVEAGWRRPLVQTARPSLWSGAHRAMDMRFQ